VIGQIAGGAVASLKLSRLLQTQKFKIAKSVGEELHLTFVDEDNSLVREKCGEHKRGNW